MFMTVRLGDNGNPICGLASVFIKEWRKFTTYISSINALSFNKRLVVITKKRNPKAAFDH